ncbi:MAG: hypothetical protein U1D55_05115 [Phycisphaerae bacterium]
MSKDADMDDPLARNATVLAPPDAARTCAVCGASARVHVLEGYRGGQPCYRSLCFQCADAARRVERVSPRRHRTGRGLALALILGGVSLGILGAVGDRLGIGANRGFGWLQQSGLATGALFVVLGALLRIDLIAIVGTILFGLAASADLLRGTDRHLIGWRQQSAILLAAVITAAGVTLRIIAERREKQSRTR